MDSISPLAKILAEANGIDWRSIHGSGEGGSVVEQDILNYLTRIMSGDEEPPATPVDETPPGWTGEMPPMPAAVAASGLHALSAAGVESDITDFVAQQQTSQPQVGQMQAGQTQASAPETVVFRPTEAQPVMPHAPVPEPEVAAAAPVTVAPPTPDYSPASSDYSPASSFAEPHRGGPENEPEPSDEDMEFELDDEGDEAEDAPAPAASTPQVPSYAALATATSEAHAPESNEPEAHPAAHEPESFHPAEAQASAPTTAPLAAEAHPAVPEFHERPAYDPAPLDEESDFVLADAFPAPAPVSAEAAPAHTLLASQPEAPALAQAQPVAAPAAALQDTAAVAGGFGLGGFLSRLYGNKSEAGQPEPGHEPAQAEAVHPEPVHTEPVHEEPVHEEAVHEAAVPHEAAAQEPAYQSQGQPEPFIGSAHAEPAEPVAATAVHEAVQEPELHEPASHDSAQHEPAQHESVLGEPLTSKAPPIPDTPVAAPLVADQWRDQEGAHGQEEAHAEPERPEMSGPEAGAHEVGGHEHGQEDAAQLTQHAHTEQAAHADPAQPIALPEAHEGGPDNAGALLGAGLLGVVGLGAAGLAAHAHHDHQPEPSVQDVHGEAPSPAEAVPADVAHAEVAHTEAPAEPQREPEAVQAEASRPDAASPAHTEAPAEQALVVSAPTPASANAVTLRLNVDLGVLETTRTQLSEALYRDVPLTLLVARAAARSLSTLGLTTAGGVALADHAGQPLAADLSGDFRASLDGLGQAASGTPALLVLDASGLGLDELHRGECSLSVGQSAQAGSALSLRGEIDPAHGARFLHEVAGLLNTPVRLLF